MVCGCASEGDYAPETYVVRPQDTLYGIAWRHDLDYRDLARWNHIGSDYRIAVGQILTLRPPARGAAGPPLARARPARTHAKTASSTPRDLPQRAAAPSASAPSPAASDAAGSGPPSMPRRRVPSRAAAFCCSGHSANRCAPRAAGGWCMWAAAFAVTAI